MRLLFTTFSFAPARNGVADAVGAVAFGLAKRGHQVTVATGLDAQSSLETPPLVAVERFRLGTAADLPDEVTRYHEFLAAADVDVVFCHCWKFWSTDLALAGLSRNHPRKVLVSHGYGAHWWVPQRRFPWGLGAWLRSLTYILKTFEMVFLFDNFIFLSDRPDANRFIDLWLVSRLRPQAYSVIPNGAPAPYFEDSSRGLRHVWKAEDRCVFLCVAEYHDAKNQMLALTAFLALRGAGVLVFVGQQFNHYSRLLERAAEANGCGVGHSKAVLVLEDQGGDFVRQCYAACDVFVLPSRRETQPLTILQAMASRRPFICTDVGCVRDLQRGGRIVREEKGMTKAMEDLARQPELRLKLGAEGHQLAREKYRWDIIIDAYESLCSSLVQPNQTAAS